MVKTLSLILLLTCLSSSAQTNTNAVVQYVEILPSPLFINVTVSNPNFQPTNIMLQWNPYTWNAAIGNSTTLTVSTSTNSNGPFQNPVSTAATNGFISVPVAPYAALWVRIRTGPVGQWRKNTNQLAAADQANATAASINPLKEPPNFTIQPNFYGTNVVPGGPTTP